jgi:thiol-disulfide isomerase/thioredoxin
MKNKIQLLILFCAVAATAYSQKPQPALLNLGDPAPPLRVGEWIKGAPVKNFEDGNVYIVDFWATWCGGCMAAFPRLSVLARKYKRKVTVIAIDVYEKKGAVAKVKALVDSMGNRMDFDVATEDTNYTVHDWIEAWGQQDEGIPCTFVVDAQKKVAWIGEPWDLHAVLPKIFNNTWNVKNAKEAAISKRKTDNYLDSLDNEVGCTGKTGQWICLT